MKSIDFLFTDVGNGQRLVKKHGGKIRYCFAWKKWLIWDEKRWRIDEGDGMPRLAKDTIADIAGGTTEVDDRTGDLINHALRSQYDGRIKAMITQASSEDGVPVRPLELDSDPMLLNCLNGTVDLRTGKLLPHDPSNLITKLAPVEFDPLASCPTFMEFLKRITKGHPDLRTYLQRAVGYCLTGDVSEKALFFLYGDGNNGKTTFVEAIRYVIGDYAGQIPVDSLLKTQSNGIPNDIAQLKGLRFVTASEAEDGKKLAEARVKQLTGMGMVQARYMYGEFFQFLPTFKIFMDANHKPEIRGTDAAIWVRIKLIPFTAVIQDHERDPHLITKLKAEASGILAWAVQGCLDWQDHGLGEPAEVKVAVAEYQNEMDFVKEFVAEVCILDPALRTKNSELFAAFGTWTQKEGIESMSRGAFFNRLARIETLKDRKVGGERGWQGIGIKSSAETEDTMDTS